MKIHKTILGLLVTIVSLTQVPMQGAASLLRKAFPYACGAIGGNIAHQKIEAQKKEFSNNMVLINDVLNDPEHLINHPRHSAKKEHWVQFLKDAETSKEEIVGSKTNVNFCFWHDPQIPIATTSINKNLSIIFINPSDNIATSHDELMAATKHELGHVKNNDCSTIDKVTTTNFALSSFISAKILATKRLLLPIRIIASPLSLITSFCLTTIATNKLVRQPTELRADAVATQHGSGDALIEALQNNQAKKDYVQSVHTAIENKIMDDLRSGNLVTLKKIPGYLLGRLVNLAGSTPHPSNATRIEAIEAKKAEIERIAKEKEISG